MYVSPQCDGRQLDGDGLRRTERDVRAGEKRLTNPPAISTFEVAVDHILGRVGWVVVLAAALALVAACVVAVAVIAWGWQAVFR
jgi:hypothetical protein